jgi:hypothetical protein
MILQDRGLEGLRIYFIFLNHPFCLMEEIIYVNFLGEVHEVLDPHELHKPVLGLLGGFSSSLILSFVGSFSLSLLSSLSFFVWFPYSFIHSCVHSIDRCSPARGDFNPFILSHIHLSASVSWLRKGRQAAEEYTWYCWL